VVDVATVVVVVAAGAEGASMMMFLVLVEVRPSWSVTTLIYMMGGVSMPTFCRKVASMAV
jgi:type IV secretory pathway protease TraF